MRHLESLANNHFPKQHAKTAMPKTLLWFSGVLLAVTILAMALVLLITRPPAPGVTPENFKMLYRGMTEAEAIAILGRKPDLSRGFGNQDTWDEAGCHIYLDIVEGGGSGPKEPCLSRGTMKLADGTTLTLGINLDHAPLGYRIGRLFGLR
jgi:hypothetical protein